MICTAQEQGENVTVAITAETTIVLIATGTIWNKPVGQSLDLNFILDQSTLG